MQPPSHASVERPPFALDAAATPYRDVANAKSALKPKARPATPFRPKELAFAGGFVLLCELVAWANGGMASGGFGLALFFVATPLLLVRAARIYKRSHRLGAIAALLALVALRCAYNPTDLGVFFGFVLVGAFALSLRAPRLEIPAALRSAALSVVLAPRRLGEAGRGALLLVQRSRAGRVLHAHVVVPLALSAVFFAVFSLANPVLAHAVAAGWSFLTNAIAFPSVLHVFFWGTSLAIGCALLRPVKKTAKKAFLPTAPPADTATPAQIVVARNALVCLNALFFCENALDAACLWAGAPPPGVRTQQYAHQGAFWLTVALVLLTVVIGVMFRGALARDPRAKIARHLAYAWMAQGLVLALGTYRRISIHIAYSGLSDLRIVGILGTTLVVLGGLFVFLKLRRGLSFPWLVRSQFDAFAVVLVLYAVTPTHWISALVNVRSIQNGAYRPLLHMFSQSSATESAATLVPLLDHSDERVRQGVAALLEQKRAALIDAREKEPTWRERDIATPRTMAALDEVAPKIAIVLDDVDRAAARAVLLELSRVANEGRSLEEMLSVPSARTWSVSRSSYTR